MFSSVVGAQSVYLRLPVMGDRQRLEESPGLGIVQSYPTAIDEIMALQPHIVSTGKNPAARFLAEQIVTLPTHEFVTEIDQGKIVRFFFKKRDAQGIEAKD
jgi:dTDP-4-amino-4,6-dideoxygalactose transaminase